MIELSASELAAWYHRAIPRIPHGNQHPTKRYLTDDQILKLFDGTVVIQEKVDGKLSWQELYRDDEILECTIIEDITGKHTVHDHVINYMNLPLNKRIRLDTVWFSPEYGYRVISGSNALDYGILNLIHPTICEIYSILDGIAQSQSHYGSPVIEGLVVKNYGEGLMGKWINDEFEDLL